VCPRRRTLLYKRARGDDGTRSLLVEGTFACASSGGSDGDLCSLDAGGASRVFAVTEGVTLRMAQLELR